MRTFAIAPVLLALACVAASPSKPASAPRPAPSIAAQPAAYGLTLVEEGRILALEDRRELDRELVAAWIAHPNAIHRARMALALGRISPYSFADTNGNGERDPGERQAGVDLLASLAGDPERNVRQTAAFALGEIGEAASVDALMKFAHDADASVAAEAIEALSKLAQHVTWPRYAEFTEGSQPDGIRARAIRFLFRFNSDEASAAAAEALAAPTAAVREAAAYALSRRAFPPARERLELLLTDPEMMARAHATAALGRIAAPESLPRLLDQLRDAYPWVRTNALVAIGRIAAKTPDALDRHEVAQDALRIVDMTDDPDPGTRTASIDVLGLYAKRSEVAKTRLAGLASEGSRWNRELAVGAWAKQFGDAHPQTNWEKVRAIEGKFDASFSNDPDPMVRAAVLGNIADDKAEANEAVIRAALSDTDVVVRANAIDRYAKLKSRDVPALAEQEQRGRSDAMNDARLAAITALGEIAYPEREAFFRSLLRDADPVVRRVAADVIEQKLKKNRPQYTPLNVDRPASEYEAIAAWSRTPHTATIRMARGDIRLVLLTQEAPMTAWNFAALARKHYFDNTTFMRVVPNFVVQGGDPRNDMNGGPGYTIRDEINMQKYTRGAVGMALSGPDTGGSQFFVTHSPQPHLDGGYTIFARVVDGMTGVVDQTERGDKVDTILIDDTTASGGRSSRDSQRAGDTGARH